MSDVYDGRSCGTFGDGVDVGDLYDGRSCGISDDGVMWAIALIQIVVI
ncbi:hypothetical protein LC653_42060 [Nostoc sp. CHAB 5784]|nr:hypothetical protein [Nostoc mirabile]MCC5670207.1 hypothetical protein [Nostoc mirabile CHAB5784]